MDAHGALDSLLGRLTTILVNEAQLLGRVRSDVEFIKEEMECMNSLILQLTETQFCDHLVRAWMKQVVGLTRDCEGNVEHYIHYVGSRPGDDGLLGHLCWIVRFLRTIPVRHRIATRIRELKIRARDVGDRRQRYGVTVPASRSATASKLDIHAEPARVKEHHRQRAVLLHGAFATDDEEVVRRGIDTLVKCLSSTEPAIQDGDGAHPQVRLFTVLGTELANKVAEEVYQQSSVSTLFVCKVWSNRGYEAGTEVLADILEQVRGVVQLQRGPEADEVTNEAGVTVDKERENQLIISKIQGHLKGKRFLIVVTTHSFIEEKEWKRIQDALLQAADGSLPGSALIMSTNNYDLALASSPYKIINAQARLNRLHNFYREATMNLRLSERSKVINHRTLDLIRHNTFAMKMFLHLLYVVNPNMTADEMENYHDDLCECTRLERSISKQALAWCYSELPNKYRSCLLYLTVFPEGHVIRTTSLARRWVAEGLITASTTSTTATDEIELWSSTDEAEHCLDVLFIRGFLSPLEISAEGNIKSCTLHHEVREFIARVATDVNFMDSNLPQHLARYLSIHNIIGLQKPLLDGDDSKDTAAYLPSLSASPQWKLLKVLDLEGCKGLAKKKNLKSICKILLLKYLSLRNTDITELPKQMKKLQCLETLDIRQTKVRVFAKKTIVLPLLKHFLAGDKISVSNDAGKCEESFSALDMPHGIHRMNNLEILSHVKITDSDNELTGIGQLLKLRKLGVALRGKNAKLIDLFCQIEQLHRSLRSLSVRLDQPAASENHGDLTTPKFIESLNISGLTSGLPHMIQQLHHLAKLTLTEAHLKEDDLSTIGRLPGLLCLRLLHKSYIQSELSFKEEEFQALKFLLVGTSDVTSITFSNGAAPKLERIIWSFPTTACVCGLRHLPELREFGLNGDCSPDQVRGEIEGHWKEPVFKHNPNAQKQEDIAAASTSSSSAP